MNAVGKTDLKLNMSKHLSRTCSGQYERVKVLTLKTFNYTHKKAHLNRVEQVQVHSKKVQNSEVEVNFKLGQFSTCRGHQSFEQFFSNC